MIKTKNRKKKNSKTSVFGKLEKVHNGRMCVQKRSEKF